MIHFDALDFICRSEEVRSFFWRSVYLQTFLGEIQDTVLLLSLLCPRLADEDLFFFQTSFYSFILKGFTKPPQYSGTSL